jgi:hypothetical protein
MKRLSILGVILLFLVAFLLWWFSPTQVLKRRTQSFLDLMTMDAGTGKSGRQLGVYRMNSLLAEQVELNTPTIEQANGTFARSELESGFSFICQQAKQTRFILNEIQSVEVASDRSTVVFSIEALVELPAYRPVDGNFQVTFHWQREKDEWRLARADWTETP